MEPGLNDPRGGALRPLEEVRDARQALQDRVLDAEGTRRAVLRIADAVDASLRRLLRDLPAAPAEARLRALDPDALRADEVLGELRQCDRISIELAASVHELLQARRRLAQGSLPEPTDPPLALRVLYRMEPEIAQTSPAGDATVLMASPEADATQTEPVAATPPRRPPVWALALAGLAALVLIVWLLAGRQDESSMQRGITLFRSGSYADAASHFWRYSQAHPDDPTPHLYLARIHRRMRRPDLAAPALREAMRLAPDDAAVHRELGFLLLDTGRADVAVERFRVALRMDRESPEGWIGLVRALHSTGREEAAQRVLAQAPDRVRELFARGAGAASSSSQP